MMFSAAVRSIWYSRLASVARADDDRVAGVDADRVEVFPLQTVMAVAVGVAHHLELDLLPARDDAFSMRT